MIKLTIHKIIDWIPSFSPLEITTQNDCVPSFILVIEINTDQKRRPVSSKITPSNDRVSVFMPLHDIAQGNSWISRFL